MIGMVKGTMRETKSVAGLPSPIASFRTNASGLVLPTLKTTIEAVQSGSGDPSPSNPRPIIGWTEANLSRTGINIINSNLLVRGSISNAGVFIDSILRLRTGSSSEELLSVIPSQDYYYQVTGKNSKVIYVMEANEYDSKKTWIRNRTINRSSGKYTPSADCYYVVFLLRLNDNTEIVVDDVDTLMLEIGDSGSAYVPYNGTTVTLQFGTTIYGGSIDWTSGVGRVTKAMVEMGNIDWVSTGDGRFKGFISDIKVAPIRTLHLMCNVYQTNLGSDAFLDKSIYNGSNEASVIVYDTTYSSGTASAFKTAMQNLNAQLVYELATPTTIQLTPQQIEQLRGENNVFVDCGEVSELKYQNMVVTKLFSKG